MACRLAGAKPSSKPMLGNCCLDPRNKLQWNLNRNSHIFIQGNAFENVVWEWRPFCLGLNVLNVCWHFPMHFRIWKLFEIYLNFPEICSQICSYQQASIDSDNGLMPNRTHHLNQSLLMHISVTRPHWVNTLVPRQNGHYIADDIFKCIFLKENDWIPIKISLKFVPKGPINNIPGLVQIMAWRTPGDRLLSELMLVSYWRMYLSLGLNDAIFKYIS